MSISKQNLYGLLSPLPVYTVSKSTFFELGQFQQSYQQSFDNFSKYVHCMFIFISLIRKVLGPISIALPVLFPSNLIHNLNHLGIFWVHLNGLAGVPLCLLPLLHAQVDICSVGHIGDLEGKFYQGRFTNDV